MVIGQNLSRKRQVTYCHISDLFFTSNETFCCIHTKQIRCSLLFIISPISSLPAKVYRDLWRLKHCATQWPVTEWILLTHLNHILRAFQSACWQNGSWCYITAIIPHPNGGVGEGIRRNKWRCESAWTLNCFFSGAYNHAEFVVSSKGAKYRHSGKEHSWENNLFRMDQLNV